MSEPRKRNLTALLIFFAAFAVLFVFHANRFVATNDEGMILEPAQRMLGGARPYVDFFGYMSPGSYWLQWGVFRIFGVSLAAGRAIVIFDFALQCALVFWLTWRIASRRAATAAVLMFAGFQIADSSVLTSAHRWDSATLALAAVAVALSEVRSRWLISGALLAAAAWCTPALLAVAAAAGVFLAIRSRRDLIPFLWGIAATSAAAILALMATGSLRAFLDQLAWLRTNYSEVNVMPYGAIIGGYRALFEDTTGAADIAVRSILVVCLALPAILPPLAISLSIVVWRRSADRALEMLMLTAAAFLLTVFPRADVAHLAFVAAVPYVLICAALARAVPARISAAMAMGMIMLACVFGSNFFTSYAKTTSVAGMRVPSAQAGDIARMFSRVRPGSTLFVYPYMPILYFATQAKNPTRFSFLAPGMMTDREAAIALDELQANPPRHVLAMKLEREEFLRVFPHATHLNWRFEALEQWIEKNYEPDPKVFVWGYRLYERRTAFPPLQSARVSF